MNIGAFNEVVDKNGNSTTCTEICLSVFKVSIESWYWEGSVGSQICFLETKSNGIDDRFGSIDDCVVFLEAVYVLLNDRIHDRMILKLLSEG